MSLLLMETPTTLTEKQESRLKRKPPALNCTYHCLCRGTVSHLELQVRGSNSAQFSAEEAADTIRASHPRENPQPENMSNYIFVLAVLSLWFKHLSACY